MCAREQPPLYCVHCTPTHTGEAGLTDGIHSRRCTAVGRGAALLPVLDRLGKSECGEGSLERVPPRLGGGCVVEGEPGECCEGRKVLKPHVGHVAAAEVEPGQRSVSAACPRAILSASPRPVSQHLPRCNVQSTFMPLDPIAASVGLPLPHERHGRIRRTYTYLYSGSLFLSRHGG